MTSFRRVAATIGAASLATAASVPLAFAVPEGASSIGGPPVTVHRSSGDFAPPAVATVAYTYDSSLVPVGARAAVLGITVARRSTIVTLRVRGLLPEREYGAHAHTAPCGPTGADAGPHYQYEPSSDPAAANPRNEVWLDFTTDRRGNALAIAVQPWVAEPERRPASVVIHDHHTSTGGEEPPGAAGARLACLTVAL